MNPDNLLCYEMNGVPLPEVARLPGAPDRPRLVRGGQRQVADAHRGLGPAVPRAVHGARLRDDPRAGSATARSSGRSPTSGTTGSSRRRPRSRGAATATRIMGAAWGAPIARVEVQVDDGPWRAARARTPAVHGGEANGSSPGSSGRCAGRTPRPASTRSGRARIDVDGNVQPPPDDPFLASKVTFWESNGQITRRVLRPRFLTVQMSSNSAWSNGTSRHSATRPSRRR